MSESMNYCSFSASLYGGVPFVVSQFRIAEVLYTLALETASVPFMIINHEKVHTDFRRGLPAVGLFEKILGVW